MSTELTDGPSPMDWLTFQKRLKPFEGWAIYADVEGFSNFMSLDDGHTINRGLIGLQRLTTALWKIGSLAYPGKDPAAPSERLFMHQFGDGYLVWPDSYEDQVERPLLICIALMRCLISQNIAIKATISTGSLSDMLGVFAHDIRDHIDRCGVARLGSGIMTFTPALGTAVSNAYKLGDRLRGAQLIVDHRAIARVELPSWLRWSTAPNTGNESWSALDWTHGTCPHLVELCRTADISCPDPANAQRALVNYMQVPPVPSPEWRESTLRVAGLLQPEATTL